MADQPTLKWGDMAHFVHEYAATMRNRIPGFALMDYVGTVSLTVEADEYHINVTLLPRKNVEPLELTGRDWRDKIEQNANLPAYFSTHDWEVWRPVGYDDGD